MVLGDTASATCAQISSLDAVWAATDAHTVCRSWHASVLYNHTESGLWVWECSTDHCWKQRHHWYIVLNMCSNSLICLSFLQAYSVKLLNRSMYASAGHGCTLEWMLLMTTVAACRDRLPECHLIANNDDKWITNITTPSMHIYIYIYIYILEPMNTVLRMLHFFFPSSSIQWTSG